MAFNKKIWKDRVAEFINRRLLTKEDGSTELVTVARSEGTISVEGDAFNAETMNDLEDRVEVAFNELNTNLVNLKNQFYNRKLKLCSSGYIDYYFCTRANQSFVEFPNRTLKKSIPANSWTKIIESIPTHPSLEVYREILVGDSAVVVIRITTAGGVWAYSARVLQIGTQFMNGFSYI